MGAELRVTIATPARVCVDDLPIVSLRAEDASGAFGIRAGHVDFVTLLRASVVRWRTADGATHYAALDGGVLRVTRGTRSRCARVDETRLHAQAVRRLLTYLRPEHAKDGVHAPLKPETLE